MNRTQHDHRALSQQPRIPQEELDRMWRLHQEEEESLRVWEFLQMKTNDESPNNTGRGSSDAGEGAGSGGGKGKKDPH